MAISIQPLTYLLTFYKAINNHTRYELRSPNHSTAGAAVTLLPTIEK
jgi:hypothetical protein